MNQIVVIRACKKYGLADVGFSKTACYGGSGRKAARPANFLAYHVVCTLREAASLKPVQVRNFHQRFLQSHSRSSICGSLCPGICPKRTPHLLYARRLNTNSQRVFIAQLRSAR